MNETITRLLSKNSSITVNKSLVQSIGIKNAIILGELLSKFYYWKDKSILNKDGYFYCTIEDLQMSTGFSKQAQSYAISKLVELNLIKTYTAGMPLKRYFSFTRENIDNISIKLQEGQKVLDEYYKNKTDDSFLETENNIP